VEVLLDSRATGLVISSEFARKQEFKLKKIERPIYVRNIDGTFNKECYELRLKGLSNRTTLVLSNTRELDRVPNTK